MLPVLVPSLGLTPEVVLPSVALVVGSVVVVTRPSVVPWVALPVPSVLVGGLTVLPSVGGVSVVGTLVPSVVGPATLVLASVTEPVPPPLSPHAGIHPRTRMDARGCQVRERGS